MKRIVGLGIVLVLGLALLPLPQVAAVHGSTQTKTYVLGGHVILFNSCPGNQGVGGVRFCLPDPHATETNPAPTNPAMVTIDISDDSSLATGGIYEFRDADGNVLGSDVICETSGPVPLPPGTSRILVWIGAFGVFGGCVASVGTTGSVTVTYSNP